METPGFLDGLIDPLTDAAVLSADGRSAVLLADLAERIVLDRSATGDERVLEARDRFLATVMAYVKRHREISHASLVRLFNVQARRRVPYDDGEIARFEQLRSELDAIAHVLIARIAPMLKKLPAVDSEDILSQALVERIAPLYLAGGIDDLLAFSLTVCENLVKDKLRRERSAPTPSADETIVDGSPEADTERFVLDGLEEAWQKSWIREAIMRLPEGAQRRAIELRLQHGDDVEARKRAIRDEAPAGVKDPVRAHNEAASKAVQRLRQMRADEIGS
jgi:DNA-directed RNA polymerase specialized sigma24 family protein